MSIYVRKGEQSLWENGIFQNCLFLAMLLQKSPRVRDVVLVSVGGQPEDARSFLADSPVPVIDTAAAAQSVDLMIEMSAQLDREWVAAFRGQGGRLVTMRVGNDFAIDVERMVFGMPQGLLITGARYDEVWTLPQYEKTCVPYFGAAAPVRIVPHLWSPVLLERARSRAGLTGNFEYQPGRTRWRLGILEPNICMVKTCFIPMLACEAAYRARSAMVERLHVYGSAHLRTKPAFIDFATSMDLQQHGLGSFGARPALFMLLPAQVDAVVAHQWENAQNYLYYEVLYGGFPLIHNSHLLADCGYRYQGFDCEEGGRALLRAFDEHDAQLCDYRDRARHLLSTLDPHDEHNVCAYTEAIETVMSPS